MTAPYIRTSKTSREAADSIEPSTESMRARVLSYLRKHGPDTDEGIQLALGMNPSTERPRRIELCRAGLVFECSIVERTRSGRWARMWSATL